MSPSPLDLVRTDLRDFTGYASARNVRFEDQDLSSATWLNANESPWPNRAAGTAQLRRYPEPQPPGLRDALAHDHVQVGASLLDRQEQRAAVGLNDADDRALIDRHVAAQGDLGKQSRVEGPVASARGVTRA